MHAAYDYEKELKVAYYIEREDDRFFGTYELGDVLNDPNIETKRVQKLGIYLIEMVADDAPAPNSEIVKIVFDKSDPLFFQGDVVIKILSEDRTWALLLADKLEPQITRLFKAKKTPRWILSLFILLLAPIVYRLGKFIDGKQFNPIEGALGFFAVMVFVIFATRIMIRLSGSPGWLVKYFGPESVFLWGDELQVYPEREKLRINIQWTVLVGFFVSFAASIVSLLF